MITFELSQNNFRINNTSLNFPIKIEDLDNILLVLKRTTKKKHNIIYTWDDLGVLAYSKNGQFVESLVLELKKDIEIAWQETKNWFDKQTELKASKLFEFAENKAIEYGWEFGGEIAGHLIGEFPHERLEPGNYKLYVHPDNHNDMFELDSNGQKRNWILEMHFIDKKNKIGGFYEQLLT
ncbi:hypothetical protein [Aquimarina sp. AU58]|uniref:DUF7738 domain-containing protein n=1 Tax=Aquimarina sp. AU58 TaxID=1874112 RepID=UPI000D6E3E02|nr:hypothetical protein [Aquimarina sp. AU58]